jgi:hypothetical protein
MGEVRGMRDMKEWLCSAASSLCHPACGCFHDQISSTMLVSYTYQATILCLLIQLESTKMSIENITYE